MANSYKVIKINNSSITGSINKLLALGATNASSTVQRAEFGNFITPEINFTASSIIEDFTVPAGTYIDGPIGRVSGSSFLAYINI